MQGAARAWWTIAVLCVAALLSVIDRGIIKLAVDPVRADLHLTEVQMGLLLGLAFGLIYSVGGVALGAVADRYNRRNLVIAGIAVWSLATIAAGLARNFHEMFAARMIVGLGEAALAPAAVSLIADLFAPDRRGRPMGVYMTGQGIANGLAITLTGLVIAASAAHRFDSIALFDGLAPWRVTFLLCGASGLFVILLLLTCPEPARTTVSQAPSLLAQARETLQYLWIQRRLFVPLYLGFAFCFMAAYGAAAWSPAMLGRVFGLGPAQLAQTLGPLAMVFAAAGPLLGGAIIDPLVRRFGDPGRLMLIAGVTLLAIPSGLAVLAPDGTAAAVLVASGGAIYPLIGLGVITALQSQWPAPMRGFGVSITGLVNTLIGAIVGPLLIAWLTERVFRDEARVGESLAIVVVAALLVGGALFVVAARAARSPQAAAASSSA